MENIITGFIDLFNKSPFEIQLNKDDFTVDKIFGTFQKIKDVFNVVRQEMYNYILKNDKIYGQPLTEKEKELCEKTLEFSCLMSVEIKQISDLNFDDEHLLAVYKKFLPYFLGKQELEKKIIEHVGVL